MGLGQCLCRRSRQRSEYSEVDAKPRLLPGLLADSEILELMEAASSWEGPQAPYGDGHLAQYLHRDGFFQLHCADLCAKLLTAMRAADEWWPASTVLRVRCIELHHYKTGADLMEYGHTDKGSALTMSVCLHPADDGGRFVTWDAKGEPVYHALASGDAILFHSEKTHNVECVRAGERRALVIELWDGDVNVRDRCR